MLVKNFGMKLAPQTSPNTTSYFNKTYNFLKSPFRKQIDKKAARKFDFGTSWVPLAVLGAKVAKEREGEREEGKATERKRKGGGKRPGGHPSARRGAVTTP